MRMWAECACYCGDLKRNMAREEGDGRKYARLHGLDPLAVWTLD
jgi:hypothetical protein